MLSRSHLKTLPQTDTEVVLTSFSGIEKEGETEEMVDCSPQGHVVSKQQLWYFESSLADFTASALLLIYLPQKFPPHQEFSGKGGGKSVKADYVKEEVKPETQEGEGACSRSHTASAQK